MYDSGELLTLPGYEDYVLLHFKRGGQLTVQRAHRVEADGQDARAVIIKSVPREHKQDCNMLTHEYRMLTKIRKQLELRQRAANSSLSRKVSRPRTSTNANRSALPALGCPEIHSSGNSNSNIASTASQSGSTSSLSSKSKDPDTKTTAKQSRPPGLSARGDSFHEVFPSSGAAMGASPAVDDRIPNALQLAETSAWIALVLEDFGGTSLREYTAASGVVGTVAGAPQSPASGAMPAMGGPGAFPSASAMPQHVRSGSQTYGRRLPVEDVLRISAQIADALDLIHSTRIMHKDVNPDNVIVRKAGGVLRVQLIDFNLAEDFGSSSQPAPNEHLDGTLLYMSPEQTGRMDRAVDYRTDLYSLGITMWELLTGSNPCTSRDPSEIVYFHLARDIGDPRDIEPSVPQPLVDIINKLVQKNPDDRYQSASGVCHDLRMLIEHIENTRGDIGLPANIQMPAAELTVAFKGWCHPLASKDFSPRLCFPSKLYGRDHDMAQIMRMYDRVSSGASSASLVCLNGPDGCGKSAIAKHISSEIAARGGTMIISNSGESDCETPYVEIASILEQLVCMILAESPDDIHVWETRLKAEIGMERLFTLATVVPSIRSIVGDAVCPNWQSTTTANRQVEVSKSVELFFGMFCRAKNPLVIFLNSLQAGLGTIGLVSHIIQHQSLRHFMIITGVSVVESDSFSDEIEMLANENSDIIMILNLAPLSITSIKAFLHDTIRPPINDVDQLADTIQRKTQGNPTHMRELLQFCEAEGILAFDSKQLGWTWNIREIETKVSVAEGIVQLLESQLQKLPPDTLTLLKHAAIIGDTAETRMLSALTGMDPPQIRHHMQYAVGAGIVSTIAGKTVDRTKSASSSINGDISMSTLNFQTIAGGGNGAPWAYKFAHGRVRVAASQLVAETERCQMHLSVARHMRALISEHEVDQYIFVLVEHNEKAGDLLVESERVYFVDLLVKAAYRFSDTGDYDKVASLLKKATSMLDQISPSNLWSEHYNVAFRAKYAYVMVLMRLRHSDAARAVVESLKPHIRESESIMFDTLVVELLKCEGHFAESLEAGRQLARKMGVEIPETREAVIANVRAALPELERLMDDPKYESLERPRISGDGNVAAFELNMRNMLWAARMSGDVPMSVLLTIRTCMFALRNGFGFYAYEFLGSSLRLFTGSVEIFNLPRARKIGDFILQKLPTLLGDQRALTALTIYVGYSIFWDFNEIWDFTAMIAQYTTESSLKEPAILSVSLFENLCLFTSGKSLYAIREYSRKLYNMIEGSLKTEIHTYSILCTQLDEFAMGIVPDAGRSKDVWLGIGKGMSDLLGLFSAFHFKHPDVVETLLPRVMLNKRAYAGTWLFMDTTTIVLACLAEKARLAETAQKKAELIAAVDLRIEILRMYAEANEKGVHVGKYHFAVAERERAAGNIAHALRAYELAIEHSRKHGNLIFEAWAFENEGMLWVELGAKRQAQECIRAATQAWQQWGADSKVQQLQRSYPEFAAPASTVSKRISRRFKSSTTSPANRTTFDNGPDGEDYLDTTVSFVGKSECSDGSRDDRSDGFVGCTVRNIVDIDVTTMLKVANSITSESNLHTLLSKIMEHLVTNTGATRAVFFLSNNGKMVINAELSTSAHISPSSTADSVTLSKGRDTDGSASPDMATTTSVTDDENAPKAPMSIINVVSRTQEPLVFTDVPTDAVYRKDPYLASVKPKSILCCPVKQQSRLIGVVYLENTMQNSAFTPNRIELVRSLMASAAMSIQNANLIKQNNELEEALRDTKDQTSSVGGPKYNLDAPIKRVFDAIEQVKARFDKNDPTVQTLDKVVKMLASDELFSANMDEINDENGRGLDQDTKTWIENSLLQKTSKASHATNNTQTQGQVQQNFAASELRTSNRSNSMLVNSSAFSRGSLSNFAHLTDPSVPKHVQLNYAEIDQYLEQASTAEFDIFHFAELTHGSPLYSMCVHFFKRLDLAEKFQINDTVVRNFFERVEAGYHKLPYHNSSHAADVLQTVAMLLLETELVEKFTALEIFCACVASAVHDLDHPGVNNNFLVQSHHPLATLYNDVAVLESHHASKAFEIAKHPEANIFHSLTMDQYRHARKSIISIVLATDLAQHFPIITRFKGKIAASSLKLEEEPDRQLVLEMAVKCGDLGNPTKVFELARRWTGLVMEEFFRQGDRERSLGLPVSMFMDRNDTNISKCQVGFLDVLVSPLFDAWTQFSKTKYIEFCQANMKRNREQWAAWDDSFDLFKESGGKVFENVVDMHLPPVTFGRRGSALHDSQTNLAGSSRPHFVYGSAAPLGKGFSPRTGIPEGQTTPAAQDSTQALASGGEAVKA
ncbi:Chk1 protein kinase [Polyrhizophydium stewartii]|uniref:Phosphodiesterase n=1 Tax=Polyrhizophydium stewartii TaxID=2732419 RepID=A0ABR4N5H0_9FUNG